MKIQQKDIYYGVALTQIAEYPTFTSINKITDKDGMYAVNDTKRILIKYASKADDNGEWRFTFRKDDFDELPAFDSFVVLVCALETICLLRLDDLEIERILDLEPTSSQWVSVTFPPGGQMRIRGSKGAFPSMVAHNSFPMRLFEENAGDEAYSFPPFSNINVYKHHPGLAFSTQDRRLDLSDTLMHSGKKRTVYLGLTTISHLWKYWTEKNLRKVENRIKNDLEFDGFEVKIERVTEKISQGRAKEDLPCETEFVWKLTIS